MHQLKQNQLRNNHLSIKISCRADKRCYLHDSRADKWRYPQHDHRADAG